MGTFQAPPLYQLTPQHLSPCSHKLSALRAPRSPALRGSKLPAWSRDEPSPLLLPCVKRTSSKSYTSRNSRPTLTFRHYLPTTINHEGLIDHHLGVPAVPRY